MKTIGESKVVTIATVAEAYGSGDVIGVPVAVDVSNLTGSGQSVMLQLINVVSAINYKLKIAVFVDEPNCGANNAVFQPNAASLVNLRKIISIDSLTNYTAGNFGVSEQMALPVCTGTKRKFWLVLIAGEAQTFAVADGVKLIPSYYID